MKKEVISDIYETVCMFLIEDKTMKYIENNLETCVTPFSLWKLQHYTATQVYCK